MPHSVQASLQKYLVDVGIWLWIIVVGFFAGQIGALWASISGYSLSVWVLLSASNLALVIAPFIAYHKLRVAYQTKFEELESAQSLRPTLRIISPAGVYSKGDACHISVANDSERTAENVSLSIDAILSCDGSSAEGPKPLPLKLPLADSTSTMTNIGPRDAAHFLFLQCVQAGMSITHSNLKLGNHGQTVKGGTYTISLYAVAENSARDNYRVVVDTGEAKEYRLTDAPKPKNSN